MSDMTIGEYANGMPSIRIGEMFRSIFRQFFWLIPLVVLGSVVIFFLTSSLKRSYQGEGRLLVQLGSEYVYDAVGTEQNNQGLLLTPDIISLNEAAIMKNAAVIEQVVGEVINEFGQERFAEAAFKEINAAQNKSERDIATVNLHKFVENNYVVMPRPKSSVVDVVFKHEDPEVAVFTTNAFIDAYLSYRRTIFVEGSGDVIAERRITTEEQLAKTEGAISSFLRRNGISDFASERTGVTRRTENLRAELNTLRANMTETEAALATVEAQLRNTPAEINLYVDDRAAQRVAQAELELKQLLAKYLPTSDPVRAKQAEINELKSLQASNGGNAVGGRRVGPNTVHQALTTRRNTLQATADSFREKEYALQQQLNAADAKVKKLQKLSPQYNNLLRERDTLDDRLKDYTNQEQQALVNQQQAETNSENVRVISYATLPRKGRNIRMIAWALGTVAWGFTLFIIALLRVFLDPKLYRAPSVRTQTISERYSVPEPEQTHYRPAAQPYIPEPVPAAAHYQNPGHYNAPPNVAPQQMAAAAYTGAAAHDIYSQQPAAAPIAGHESQSTQIIGTVPSAEHE